MGVPGVAIATIISQIVSAIGCITLAMIKVNILRMPIKQIKPSKEIFIKCIKLGLPVAIQNSFISLSTMLLQGVINSYGETVMAAATAAARVEQLILQPGMSIGVAVATFTGQNIGAGKIERVKKGFWAASKIIIIFSLFMLPCIYFGGNAIMKLFTNAKDVEVARIGMEAMRVTCFFYSFVGMIFVSRNLLSGAGDMKIPMIMGFVEVVCRVAFAAILSSTALEYQGLWWATGLTWLFTSFFGIARYSTGKWRFKSVVRQN
jgi:Na+-driven multidrug efflux pump